MPTMILDPELAEQLRAQRAAWGGDRYDEVWEGTYMMQALPNNEHQKFVARLTHALEEVIGVSELGDVFPGVNVSDRVEEWTHNYRCPDVAVFLKGTKAVDLNTFWHGGPDLAIEIVSPEDRSREKIDFYAIVNTRELLIIDRNPWQLELYRLNEGTLKLVGTNLPNGSVPLVSETTGVTFELQLDSKHDRPLLIAKHPQTDKTWTI
jgi:Uma2 family endonuclease